MDERGERARASAAIPVLIWDLPTRFFHWMLAASFLIALVTGDSDEYRDLHVFFGYLAGALIVFRVFWGFVGSRYARFGSFLYGPREAIAYVRALLAGSAGRHLGHNPAGSWAIYGLLALGAVVCVSGIVVLGAEESQGPLASLASHPLGDLTKELHESLSWLMLVLVLLHLGGVVVESLVHRENLAMAMVTGRKLGAAGDGIASPRRLIAVAMLASAAAGAAWFLGGRLINVPGAVYLPFVGKALPDNPTWREECGSCHVAFHPSLLPARSWTALMDRQNDHFGEKLGLDPTTVAVIMAFLQENSAETGITEAAYKINRSIPSGETPLRVTETPYWIEKHRSIDAQAWKHPKVGSKSNCSGCHRDAERGTYEDAAMQLPR